MCHGGDCEGGNSGGWLGGRQIRKECTREEGSITDGVGTEKKKRTGIEGRHDRITEIEKRE